MSKFAQQKTPEEIFEKMKRQNAEMRKLLEEAVKGKYGIWSNWCNKVKIILGEK